MIGIHLPRRDTEMTMMDKERPPAFDPGCPFCRKGNWLVADPDDHNGADDIKQHGNYEDDFLACSEPKCEMRCCIKCMDPMRNHFVECAEAKRWQNEQRAKHGLR